MKQIRITVRCSRNSNHAKILCLKGRAGWALAKTLAELLDGTSPLYIYKPGDLSPIGRCAVCHAPTSSEVSEVEKHEVCPA